MEEVALFEALCSELSVDPQAATQKLLEFRDTANALDVTIFIMKSSTNPNCQFQSLIIMQYAFLKRWEALDCAMKETLKGVLWSKVTGPAVMPHYLTSKVVQTFAVIWKRDWVISDVTEKTALFSILSSSLQSSDLTLGQFAFVLRTVVEEFSGKSSADIGVPIHFHRAAHKSFESYGLNQVFEACMAILPISLEDISRQALTKGQGFEASCANLIQTANLFLELLFWDFGGMKNFSSDLSVTSDFLLFISLPRAWSTAISAVGPLFTTYETIRNVISAHLSPESDQVQFSMSLPLSALETLRQIFVALAIISGGIFDSIEERIVYAERYCSCLLHFLSFAFINLDKSDAQLSIEGNSLREKEIEAAANILGRFLGNFQLEFICRLPSFQPLIICIGEMTFRIASALALDVECESVPLLESWKGDAVSLLLDAWGKFIESPLLLIADAGNNGALHAQEHVQHINLPSELKLLVRKVAIDVFQKIFDSVLYVTIADSLKNMNEDEDGDVEAIVVSSLEDFVSGASRLGRANPALSVKYVTEHLIAAVGEIDTLACDQSSSTPNITRLLETCRVCIFFASNICFGPTDDYVNKSSETRLIPPFILDACLFEDAPVSLLQLVNALASLLQLQMRLSVNRNIFFSPLIAQNLITFFADYIPVYLDPCIDLYSSGPERRSRALSLHGEDFNDVLVLLCHSCQHCIVAHPLEEDLLTSVSKLIQALASSEQRLGIIVSQSSIMEIYAYVSRTTDDLGITNCRLSPVGLATMTEALVKLSSQKGCRTLFVQLCSTAHDRLEHLSSIAEGNPAQETRPEVYEEISACTATLIGLARTPLCSGDKQVLYRTFSRGLPLILHCLDKYGRDDSICSFLLMLHDYAECQLMTMPPFPALTLYRTTYEFLRLLSGRFSTMSLLEATSDVGNVFKEESILLVFELLGHLANRDFFDFDPADDMDNIIPELFNSSFAAVADPRHQAEEVSDILIFAVETVVPWMSPELLRSFRSLPSKKMTSASSLASVSFNTNLLVSIVNHLIWGAGAIDSVSARIALQGLNQLAMCHGRSVASGGLGFGQAAVLNSDSLFSLCLQRIFEMIIFPSCCDYGITSDRVDSCASTFITLISMDVARFNDCARSLILQQPSQIQQPMMDCLEKLVSSNGVDICKFNDTRNRLSFIQNMRQFIAEIRPLVIYK